MVVQSVRKASHTQVSTQTQGAFPLGVGQLPFFPFGPTSLSAVHRVNPLSQLMSYTFAYFLSSLLFTHCSWTPANNFIEVHHFSFDLILHLLFQINLFLICCLESLKEKKAKTDQDAPCRRRRTIS
jgi:hypothetical protein